MSLSSHAFCCWIGTLPVLMLNFIIGNPAGALAVGILSGTILLIAGILYVLEKKKKIKPLNNTILLRWRHEALGRLRFIGVWSGYWETRIDGIWYRGEVVSGFKFLIDDSGTFIQDALIDRAKLAKNPQKYSEELDLCRYGKCRYVDAEGNVEQCHW